jgi:signal transduction histidine kinase
MATVAIGGGLAVVFGLVQAGRAYLRAVELARRQAEFLAAVSHELRTPLAAVGLLAENIESGVAERAGQSGDHARRIREESQRLGGLVENVLAYARGERSGAREDFDAAALVREAVSLVGPLAARRGVALEVAIPEFPEAARGDAAALRRAVVNLLDNALKHTPAGGLIRCQLVREAGAWWRIEVADTGPGIPPAERDRVCEPFYRVGEELRRETPGAGLGLALVKRTVESHGGRLQVGEAPEGGALFTLHLPLRAPNGS